VINLGILLRNYDNLPILATKRLYLRPMLPSDTDVVVRWRNSKHVSEMSRESFQRSITPKQHLEWFHRTRQHRVDYIIMQLDGNVPIGSVNYTLCEINGYERSALSGRYIGEVDMMGRGYAFEAAHRWLSFGFEELQLEFIWGYTREQNLPNIWYNRKLGLRITPFPPELRPEEPGWVCMQITKKDWGRMSKC